MNNLGSKTANCPKVSVVIPCYNHGKFIDEAVDSILNQTFQDFEIIIVNDGSNDKFSISKLKNYNKPKTKVISIKNGGPSKARNVGIKNARGKYMLTLDADDKFHPSFLKKAVKILENNKDIGVVTCILQEFGERNKMWNPRGGNVKDFLIENNCCSGALFRKECWEMTGGYNETLLEGYEDWDFWILVTSKGWRVYSIPDVLFFYRFSDTSRNVENIRKHALLVSQIARNHKKIFQKYIDFIVFEKEKKILELSKNRGIIGVLTRHSAFNVAISIVFKLKRLVIFVER